jgi:hypothetical protein
MYRMSDGSDRQQATVLSGGILWRERLRKGGSCRLNRAHLMVLPSPRVLSVSLACFSASGPADGEAFRCLREPDLSLL